MIRPSKFLDLNYSIIVLSSEIIKIMLEEKVISYNELYLKVESKKQNSIKHLFLPALNFLFLIGKINYYEETDLLEMIY